MESLSFLSLQWLRQVTIHYFDTYDNHGQEWGLLEMERGCKEFVLQTATPRSMPSTPDDLWESSGIISEQITKSNPKALLSVTTDYYPPINTMWMGKIREGNIWMTLKKWENCKWGYTRKRHFQSGLSLVSEFELLIFLDKNT